MVILHSAKAFIVSVISTDRSKCRYKLFAYTSLLEGVVSSGSSGRHLQIILMGRFCKFKGQNRKCYLQVPGAGAEGNLFILSHAAKYRRFPLLITTIKYFRPMTSNGPAVKLVAIASRRKWFLLSCLGGQVLSCYSKIVWLQQKPFEPERRPAALLTLSR